VYLASMFGVVMCSLCRFGGSVSILGEWMRGIFRMFSVGEGMFDVLYGELE
jgi:hypothetical protein